MSTDTSASNTQYWIPFANLDSRSRNVLRLSLGATATLAVAYAIEWPLSFVSGVFVWLLLKHPEPGWGVREGMKFTGSVFRGIFCGLLVGILFDESPPMMFLALTLIFFLSYYALYRGADTYDVLFMLVGNSIVPLFALKSAEFAVFFAWHLFLAGVFAVFMALIMYGIFPEPAEGHDDHHGGGEPLPKSMAIQAAARATLVVMPVIVVWYTFGWTSWFLTLPFVAIISLEACEAGSTKFGMSFVRGVILGGVGAVLVFYMLEAVPVYLMLVLLMCFAALFFASQYYSDNPLGKYYAMGFSTIVILTATSTLYPGVEEETKLIGRLGRIGFAAVYVIAGMNFIEKIWPLDDGSEAST